MTLRRPPGSSRSALGFDGRNLGEGGHDREGRADVPYHVPVMVEEVVAALRAARGGRFIDGTLGGGGHTRALLEASPEVRVLGIDRDRAAVDEARASLVAAGVAARAVVVQAPFSSLCAVAEAEDFLPCDGLLLDLGISSHHVDAAERGFSFDRDGPLDMRMDPTRGESAADLLARVDASELADLLRLYGEVRGAGRLARGILGDAPPATTRELGQRVDRIAPGVGGPKGLKPRVFQALRIAVNDELGELDRLLAGLPEPLVPGGRLAVISYHSLEDRRVKRAIDALAGGCTCPPRFPVCVCGVEPALRPTPRRALTPDDAETRTNRRARSAKLRVAERVGTRP